MPETSGTVQCVRVATDSAFTCINQQGATVSDIFILWWDGLGGPDSPRIIQSDWVSLLRQGLASGIPVTITHDDNSSYVLNVQLGLDGTT
jgi:hypothetical protein